LSPLGFYMKFFCKSFVTERSADDRFLLRHEAVFSFLVAIEMLRKPSNILIYLRSL
jgi:hypothetical protein